MAVDGFRFSISQPVVLRDLDGFDHVNNAVYLTYVENGRVAYLREIVGAARRTEIGNIMASATLEFRAPLSYGDTVEIAVRVESIGTKSFQLAYRLVRADGEVVADASSAQVMFDFATDRTIPVPAQWREAIAAHERWS
jgi:acyl-CoA thioester hydrolase